MTDKAKTIGLPTDEEIANDCPEDCMPEWIMGAKWMRSEAEARIKEVAIEFAVWCNNTDVDSLTPEKAFDIFLEERSKNGN